MTIILQFVEQLQNRKLFCDPVFIAGLGLTMAVTSLATHKQELLQTLNQVTNITNRVTNIGLGLPALDYGYQQLNRVTNIQNVLLCQVLSGIPLKSIKIRIDNVTLYLSGFQYLTVDFGLFSLNMIES